MPRHPDAFDMGDADERAEPADVTCRFCGQDGLYWQETWDAGGRPRPKLYENGKPHVCKPSADDFDEVPA